MFKVEEVLKFTKNALLPNTFVVEDSKQFVAELEGFYVLLPIISFLSPSVPYFEYKRLHKYLLSFLSRLSLSWPSHVMLHPGRKRLPRWKREQAQEPDLLNGPCHLPCSASACGSPFLSCSALSPAFTPPGSSTCTPRPSAEGQARQYCASCGPAGTC